MKKIRTSKRTAKVTAIILATMMIFQVSFVGAQAVNAAEIEPNAVTSEQTEEAVTPAENEAVETEENAVEDEVKAEEPIVEEEAENIEEAEQDVQEAEAPAAAKGKTISAKKISGEAEAVKALTIEYSLNTPSDASFVPEIKGIEGNSEVLETAEAQAAYEVRGLSRNLYQTQKDAASAKISYEFMGWKTETGAVISSADVLDITKFDKNKDGKVKLTATWSNTFGHKSDGKYRYTTFSIYKTGAVPGLIDNTAGNYVSGIYGTIAYPGDAKEPLMSDWKNNTTGRIIVNNDSNDIGLDECDKMIRGMTETPVSNYYDSRNGNEAAGYTEYEISLMDFPTDEEVMDNLRSRIEGGLKIKVVEDGVSKTISATENFEDFDTEHYEVKWFSVKYQNNGIHIDGIVVPKAPVEEEIIEEAAEEEEVIDENNDEEVKEEVIDENNDEEVKEEVVDENNDEEVKEEAADESTVDENKDDDSSKDENNDNEGKTAAAIATEDDDDQNGGEAVSQKAVKAISTAQIDLTSKIKEKAFMVMGESEGQKTMTANAAAATIDEKATPAAAASSEEEVTIEETAAPLAAGSSRNAEGTWAVLNLIIAIITAAAALKMTLNRRKSFAAKALALIIAAAAAVIFILTQDVSMVPVLTDEWTALMAVILGFEAATAIIRKEEEEEEAIA